MPSKEPPASAPQTNTSTLPQTPTPQSPIDLSTLPRATPLASGKPPEKAVLESDDQSKHDQIYLLTGDVLITYRDHLLRADTITYNADTGDVDATGHVRLSGGANDEFLNASRGTFNLLTGTGRFYDVIGSVGLRPSTGASTQRPGYLSPNPFLFQGREVVKTGPTSYEIFDGSVTSCLLPHPDWQLFSRKFVLDGHQAHAVNSTFKLLGVPLFFLPYVTHPTDTAERQSGLLIPVFGDSSSKGIILGEQYYLTLGRSADITVGLQYYSIRGYAESGTFRYRGPGEDFLSAHFSALQDRGYTPTGGAYTNQGGQDVTLGFRKQLTPTFRAVGDAEYLSSYVYREAFTETFNQAVSSDITSIVYFTTQSNGVSLDLRGDRYQGLKRVPVNNASGQEVRIFHAPSIDFTAVDHPIPHTPLLWNLTSSAAGLKRVQPNFVSSGIIERFDLRPELSLPLSGGGWHTLSSIAVDETVYSRSRRSPYGINAAPFELTVPVNRSAFEIAVDIRPPVFERTFNVPANSQWLLGKQVRHTIEPELTYRNIRGIDNFLSVLRFDDKDLLSNTDELEYGVTQHLYFNPRAKTASPPRPRPGCPATPAAARTSTASPATGTVPAAQPVSSALPDAPDAPDAPALPDADAPDALGAPDLPDAPDALDPVPQASNDANGIPNASAAAPDAPTRTHPRHLDPCSPHSPLPPQKEWFSWRVAQKYFFDPNFGGAVIRFRRNLFDATLNFSGIAFLTEPRNISPLISRMRFRSSAHTDIEWDLDYDTGASKFTSNNIFFDTHVGPIFGGVSYARLNAPGRFATQNIDTGAFMSSSTSNFSQMRLLLGYGTPSSPGLSIATNAGLDLSLGTVQYGAVQASYNWNCCGLMVEYRKFELGSVRNENVYRFNFTLANIGTAGNLRRAEQIF